VSAAGVAGGRLRARAAWAERPERGSIRMLKGMIWVSRHLGRGFARIILYITTAYYFAFAPTARHHARRYLRRVLARVPTARDRFRLLLSFASTIHDRLFFMDGRFDMFDIAVDNEDLIRSVLEQGQGACLIGAHLGSFEAVRALGVRQPGLAVVLLMFEDQARRMSTILEAIEPAARPEIIGLGHIDAMLAARSRLDQGALIGIMGDRSLGDEPGLSVDFLGVPARFPLGPFRAAALFRRQVVFMLGLYLGGKRYRIVFEPLADFRTLEGPSRAAAIDAAVRRYIALLEQYCRRYPYNWFNFLDFWDEDDAGPHAPP
jgi:predicted LPLAT superfamily acyltransferase